MSSLCSIINSIDRTGVLWKCDVICMPGSSRGKSEGQKESLWIQETQIVVKYRKMIVF